MEVWKLFGTVDLKDEASSKLGVFSKKFKGTENTVDSGTSKMSNVLGKVGGAIAGAFAVKKLIDFGVTTVETTARLEAMEAKFGQVFKGDSEKAMQGINNQSKEMGIHADRLKDQWGSFGGMFKGFGMDATSSMTATERATKIAADASAYYDKSLEDTGASLKSFMMGNLMAGDAIGVNYNATMRDADAKEKYGKAWKDLTQEEQQFLMLDVVDEIYKQNGAMGQASRESGEYGNVIGNLKATWERFLQTIGSPILNNVVIPAMQGLMGVIEAITPFALSLGESFQNLFDKTTQASDGTSGLALVFGTLKDIFIAVKDGFIAIVDAIVLKAQEWYTNNQATVDNIVNTFNIALGYIKDIFNGIVTIVLAIWDSFGSGLFSVIGIYLNMVMSVVSNVLGVIKGIIQIITSAIKGDWNGVWEGIKNITSNVFEGIKTIISSILEIIKTIVSTILSFIGNIFSSVWNGIKNTTSNIWNSIKDAMVTPLIDAKNRVSALIFIIKDIFSNVWSNIKSNTSNTWNGIKESIMSPINNAKDGVRNALDNIKGFFSNLSLKFPKLEMPKLPHFKLNGEFSLKNMTVPKLGVDRCVA